MIASLRIAPHPQPPPGLLRSPRAGHAAANPTNPTSRHLHARDRAPQVVSAKIFVDPVATFPERVNAHLPGQIRILGVTRVTEGFNSRMYCDKRR